MATIWTVEGMISEHRTEILPEVLPESSAYIIMTSGTTGIPKGAEISHKGAWNTIEDVNKRAMIGSENVFLGVSALDFDLSVYDIFGTLGIGGTLIMISDENSRNAEYWLKMVEEYQVTIWNSVPILLNMLLICTEAQLELISRILGHSSTETTRIYAVPSVEMMRKAMESGKMSTDEKPLWPDDEAEMARICGLR